MRVDPTKKLDISTSGGASSKIKLVVLLTTEHWGYRGSLRTYWDRQMILRAASRMCAYANVFMTEFSIPTLSRWDEGISDDISLGVAYSDIRNSKNTGSQASVSSTELAHPGYMHLLFRDAVKKRNKRFICRVSGANKRAK